MSNPVSQDFYGPTARESLIPNKAWPIRRYSRREGSTWTQVDDGNGGYTLHTKVGQLMLVQNVTVLESLSLISPGQLQGVHRDDTLLITARHQNIARKFRIRFESVPAAADCVGFLRSYFPIRDVTKKEENLPATLGQIYNRLLQADSADQFPSPEPLPPSFPLEEMVKMCILDPTFPDLVARVGAVVSRIDQSNK